MSQKISVILLEDITNLGRAGDIVDVKEGYARNFLFPRGQAALADDKAKNQVASKKKQDRTYAEQQLAELQAKATALEGTELTLMAEVKDGDDIYGAITNTQISKEISRQSNAKVKAKDIILTKPITKLGTFDATLQLSTYVEAQIKITIKADPKSTKSDDEE